MTLESLKKGIKKPAIYTGLGLVLLAILVFGYNFAYKNKIFPQTYIGGINLGGKTKAEAQKVLTDATAKSLETELTVKYEDKSQDIKRADLDLTYSPEKSATVAWEVGRKGKFGKIVKEQIKSIFGGNKSLAVFTYNEGKLNDKLIILSNAINKDEKDATLKIENLEPVLYLEEDGKKLDFDYNKTQIIKYLGSFKQKEDLVLKVDVTKPKITKEGTVEASAKAKEILQSKVVLESDIKTYSLEPADIAKYLNFTGMPVTKKTATGKINLKETKNIDNNLQWVLTVEVDSPKIAEYLNGIGGEINKPSKDAKFTVSDGKVQAFQIAETGYELDKDKANSEIADAILGVIKTIKLPVKVITPELGDSDPAKIGLTELIGEGHTSWRGSPSNRIHNLSLGAEKISGTIVKPGEEFSTIKTIGAIDGSTGFLPELVIKNSTQVVPEFGGGLCQVSTTLFRAALYSGLEITQREPHSFRVSYYEPPVGMDATIYDPSPDFKFINNTGKPILIWAIAGNNTLDFQIYGTKDGRKIEISDPVLYDYISPGAPVYTESASMEPGSIRQVERATPGVTASFHYKVTAADGKVLQNETYVSKYVALSNSYYVGPGYTAPPAE